MVIWYVTGGAALLWALGEALHARRVWRLAPLAFGPSRRPAGWARAVPFLRTAAAAALAWGLVTLLTIAPKVHKEGESSSGQNELRHLLIVLDVSPSMRLEDAGPSGEQSRMHRARDVVESLFGRVSLAEYRTTVVAVYTDAKPVVVDTRDADVVRNILGDLPMQFAFRSGKTELFRGLEEAAEIARPWEPKSTLLMLISDGDTVPATGMPQMPRSIADVLVIGVGDPLTGTFIDGAQSRQDASTLRQIAVRLGGSYHDGNERHVPTDLIRRTFGKEGESGLATLGRREYALLAVAAGAALLAFLPVLLHWFGTAWQPGVRRRSPADERPEAARRAAREPAGVA